MPIYLTHEVKEIVQEKIPYIVEKKEVEIVEKEKVVVMNVEKEVIKLVEVERKVPYEVIVEKEVPLIQEKIVDRVVTVRDIEIRDREVVIPFRHEVPVEIIQEKAVEIKKIIENILQVPQVINKNVILYETKIVPEIHKVEVEKVVEVEKEKVFTDTRNVIEYQVQYQEIIKEKLVKETEKIEILKPEPYIVEKFIIQNDIHESGIEVRLEKPIAVT